MNIAERISVINSVLQNYREDKDMQKEWTRQLRVIEEDMPLKARVDVRNPENIVLLTCEFACQDDTGDENALQPAKILCAPTWAYKGGIHIRIFGPTNENDKEYLKEIFLNHLKKPYQL